MDGSPSVKPGPNCYGRSSVEGPWPRVLGKSVGRTAWGYVRRAESVLGVPLMSTKAGKGSARGTIITNAARDIVAMLAPPVTLRRSESKTALPLSYQTESCLMCEDERQLGVASSCQGLACCTNAGTSNI
jgi:hypothetical protein